LGIIVSVAVVIQACEGFLWPSGEAVGLGYLPVKEQELLLMRGYLLFSEGGIVMGLDEL